MMDFLRHLCISVLNYFTQFGPRDGLYNIWTTITARRLICCCFLANMWAIRSMVILTTQWIYLNGCVHGPIHFVIYLWDADDPHQTSVRAVLLQCFCIFLLVHIIVTEFHGSYFSDMTGTFNAASRAYVDGIFCPDFNGTPDCAGVSCIVPMLHSHIDFYSYTASVFLVLFRWYAEIYFTTTPSLHRWF